MKTCRVAALLLIGVGMPLHYGWCAPVDLSAPSGELGAANSKGYLEIWREIDDVGLQLGKGSYLPLRYKFSTDPTVGGLLGPGFYIPMFEAKNVLIRESTMRAYLPCGKGLYMWRDNVDPNKFKSVDQQWTGYLTGDDYVVWRDDGWKVQYHKSRLSSITSDDGHVFTWTYDRSGFPQEVSENGQSLITLEPNAAGQIAALVFNGKRYELHYAERPITEMLLGQVGIKELDQALSSFKYPDGKSETFHFALTPDRVPMVTFTDPAQKQIVYTWDTATAHIATEKGPEGNWEYKIGVITQDFGLSPISRTSSDGKSEGITVDSKMGTYTSTGTDGVTTVTHVFETPGPLYHKVQQIDKVKGNTQSLIYRASYDEVGRLSREVDDKGYITNYAYAPNGNSFVKTHAMTTDKYTLAALALKEKELLAQIAESKDPAQRGDLVEQLGFFYAHQMQEPEKALELVGLTTNKQQIFNIKAHAIEGNFKLSDAQKIEALTNLAKEFPEQQHLIATLIDISRKNLDSLKQH